MVAQARRNFENCILVSVIRMVDILEPSDLHDRKLRRAFEEFTKLWGKISIRSENNEGSSMTSYNSTIHQPHNPMGPGLEWHRNEV